MKKVQVLLSSYNGQKYIREQLDSIINQKGVEVHCLVRDDGSIDNTVDILREYQKEYENLEVCIEDNIGYKASFMKLLNMSGEFDFYAFSDQDDVWKDDKLLKAIEKIGELEVDSAVMYCSNCFVVDTELNHLQMLHTKEKIIPSSNVKALVQGFAHGCTMVLNSSARNLIVRYKTEQEYAHDFWIPIVIFFTGKVIYDENSYILYRQHDNNVFGNESSFKKIMGLRRQQLKNKSYFSNMILELLNGYGEQLSSKDFAVLKDLYEYKNSIHKKIKLVFNKEFKRDTLKGTLFLKFLIIFSRY